MGKRLFVIPALFSNYFLWIVYRRHYRHYNGGKRFVEVYKQQQRKDAGGRT